MVEPLGELLRDFRTAALLSQEALAERARLSVRTVSDIETGSARTPRLVTVMLLAEALGLDDGDRNRLRDAARKPAARAAVSAPVAPPRRTVALLGRDSDVARVRALLTRDGVRLITLAGPAGVGKTSLALEIASEFSASFELGATVVELASVADPSHVARAVAHGLGLRESAESDAGETVASHFRDRSALLVLDNLEHLTPAAAWIGNLLAQCPRLSVLATSREPLHLRAEHVYPVRPLESKAAIALFVQRAQMLKPDFELTEANAAAVETIVDHLEGLPLAIELAAPRLQLLPVKALAARLERRLPLLGDGASDRPLRQQTMHGAIAWSYDLLSQDEQRVFRRLAVLCAGGSLDFAAAAAGEEESERTILMQLAPLVDKSMVALVEDSAGEPRVAMLEMLREFAQERLAESGELDATQRRFAQHLLEFARDAHRELSGSQQGQSLARFEREHANVVATLEWALAADETVFGFELLGEIWRYWWLHGHLIEGIHWIDKFLARRSAGAQVPDARYANVVRARVVLLSALGSFDEARTSCEEAIGLYRELDNASGLTASLTSLGIILQFCGDHDGAEAAHAEALAIRRERGDDVGAANSLSNLASVAFTRSDFARATALGEESVEIYRRLGHESGIAHALMKIGLAASAQSDLDRAEQIFAECLRLQRAVGDLGSLHYSLINLGVIAHKRGNYALAMERFHEALDQLETVRNKSSLANLLGAIGSTTAELGDPARGARLLAAGDALRGTLRAAVFPAERAGHEAEMNRVRDLLGDESFDVQWRIGASMTLERALEEARETRFLEIARER